MEFPELGKNCSDKSCKQLDFLPVKCDACRNVYCTTHFAYDKHNCPDAYKKDNQVPVCPLCNKPIPVPKGRTPDMVVGQHIDTDCQSDPAREKRGKIFSNKCSKKGCKQKELVPFTCEQCQKNFCIKHRHETDHSCKGFQDTGKGISKSGAAAVNRGQMPNNAPGAMKSPAARPNVRPQQTNVLSNIGRDLDSERRDRQRALQGGMTEDEAMAQAFAMSLQDSPAAPAPSSDAQQEQEEADAALARALYQSEQEVRNQQQQQQRRGNRQQSQSQKSSCTLS